MDQSERLDYLIKALADEQPEYRGMRIPDDETQKKRLLRSLMNVRRPASVSDEFLRIQDEYLRREIAEKGITDAEDLPFIQDRISLWQGDITTLKCGAIVNAANSGMLGCFVPCHGCIDNAIHTYAGVQLRLECDEIMRAQGRAEETGRAKITKAYNLPCDYVLHTVGPIVGSRLTNKDCDLLRSCYISCLELAEKNGISSVAFCCISTGEFHFPNETAARIAVDTVTEYLKESNMERVIFNVFKDQDKDIYARLLG